ncbi:RluA family pseudouridine synthase [Yersinia intermedia]|uniref:RluA family pseudouridine synthase n=1 Tax=Yersinia intermedia TaxID=631 RepID=UPI0021BD8EEB|nr:pseudouridine synthase [Yersinia intermedia]
MSTIIDTFIAPPCHDKIEILYQDDHLVLINKPAGLLSLSGKNPQNLDSVHHRLVQIFPGCTLVHRLDFGTSGLMVIARNKVINAALCQQFSQRTVTKVYSALLCGHLDDNEGMIDAAIAKDPALFPLMSICSIHGKPARSHYQVVERFYHELEDSTLLPLTRVQLTAGHKILMKSPKGPFIYKHLQDVNYHIKSSGTLKSAYGSSPSCSS